MKKNSPASIDGYPITSAFLTSKQIQNLKSELEKHTSYKDRAFTWLFSSVFDQALRTPTSRFECAPPPLMIFDKTGTETLSIIPKNTNERTILSNLLKSGFKKSNRVSSKLNRSLETLFVDPSCFELIVPLFKVVIQHKKSLPKFLGFLCTYEIIYKVFTAEELCHTINTEFKTDYTIRSFAMDRITAYDQNDLDYYKQLFSPFNSFIQMVTRRKIKWTL